MPVRRDLGVRTVFNLLGPLTNPAGACRQLIGVSDPAFLEMLAGALALLGVEHALVVSSEDGLDELSTSAATRVDRGQQGMSCAPTRSPRPTSGSRWRRSTTRAAARRRTRRSPAPSSKASRAPAPTSRSSTPAPPSTPAAWPPASPRASSGARAAAGRGGGGSGARRVRASQPGACAGRSAVVSATVLDEILARTRSDLEQRKHELPD